MPSYCTNSCAPHFSKLKQNTPCSNCENKRPILLDENMDAYFLYSKINTQFDYNMGYKVRLDYNAVFKTAEIFDIEITPAIFNKLKAIEKEELKKQGEEKNE